LCNIIVSVAGLLLAVAAQADATAIELHAQGVQIYVCEQASDAPAWRLKGPEAILRDATGSEAGRHFFGPSWQANDGSTVVQYDLAIELVVPLPGFVKRRAERRILNAIKEMKAYAEA